MTKQKRLSPEQEILLTDAYFFAKERGFTPADKLTIEAFNAMASTFEQRFKESGLKHKAPAKTLGISVITLWRRFQLANWRSKEEVISFLRLINNTPA